MKKIAISGKAKAGKDTTAKLIKQLLLPQATEIVCFADPIKRIIKIMFPETPDVWLWGPSELRQNIIPNSSNTSVRNLLIQIGKLGREKNPDIWINSVLNEINSQLNFLDAVIISDCRFLNEFERLRQENFCLIRVVRPANDFRLDDISETNLDHLADSEFDYTINNSSTIDDLLANIKEIVS